MTGADASPTSITFRFTRDLPLAVYVGSGTKRQRWVISYRHFPKGKAAIVAAFGERIGYFCGGRPSHVEAVMGRGIVVPIGTIRFRLVQAMVEEGAALIVRL